MFCNLQASNFYISFATSLVESEISEARQPHLRNGSTKLAKQEFPLAQMPQGTEEPQLLKCSLKEEKTLGYICS